MLPEPITFSPPRIIGELGLLVAGTAAGADIAGNAADGIPTFSVACFITSGFILKSVCNSCIILLLSVGLPAFFQAVISLSAVTLVVKFLPTVASLLAAAPATPLTLSHIPASVTIVVNSKLIPASVKCIPPLGLPKLSFNAQAIMVVSRSICSLVTCFAAS